MEPCCQSRRNILGTYEGTDEDQDREDVEYEELQEILRGREYLASDGHCKLYKCPICGQYWFDCREATTKDDRIVYYKTNLEEAFAKFPELRGKI